MITQHSCCVYKNLISHTVKNSHVAKRAVIITLYKIFSKVMCNVVQKTMVLFTQKTMTQIQPQTFLCNLFMCNVFLPLSNTLFVFLYFLCLSIPSSCFAHKSLSTLHPFFVYQPYSSTVAPDTINNHVKTCHEEQKSLHFYAPEYGGRPDHIIIYSFLTSGVTLLMKTR